MGDAMNDTMMAIFARGCALLRRFAGSRRGNVAMIFAIALVPMTIATGVGLDYARAALTKSQLADAVDAAALAVGSGGFTSQDAAQKAAQAIFDANYKGPGKPTVAVTSFNSKGSVTLGVSTGVATTLLQVVDKTPITVGASSTVVWGQSKLWVTLVLDNSGSMCEPLSQPCVNTTDTRAKIYQLKAATKTMLTKLQGASVNAGDVMVGIVPFNREVHVPFNSDGTTFSNTSSWIDWSFWEASPAGITLSTNVGPGSNCPFSSGSNGYTCVKTATNGAGSTSTIPSSGVATGLICPGADSGAYNTDRLNHYYNGCWDSVIAQTQVVTKVDTTPITTKQTCTQVNSGTISCANQNGYPKNGTTTSNSTTVIQAGYSGDSGPTLTSNTPAGTTSDGSQNCVLTNKNKTNTCTWTRTISQTKTDTTVTKTAYGGYTHTWRPNAHSTWSGCITDRYSQTHGTPTNSKTADYDTQNIAPGSDTTGFTADNPTGGCPVAGVSALVNDSTTTDVTALGKLVDKMQAAGSTNQAIGVAHGWQMLTKGDPYGTLALPANTSRYIILLSDGLNTQNRWWGNGSTEGTVQDGYIDDRMKLTCDAAKKDGVVIYTLYVHVNGGGNSTPLTNCATDTAHYYDLTTAAAIDTAFSDIAQKITNVRLSQ
jgi:Flp pilus assembly protein TadG